MAVLRFLLFFIGASLALQAQNSLQPATLGRAHPTEKQAKMRVQNEALALRYPLLYTSASHNLSNENLSSKTDQLPALASILKQTAMPHAFFCKLELKIDKAANINCRFRLGSVDYVDYLEGKRRQY